MPSEDPLESVAKGATKAFLEHAEQKMDKWITKFRNRELAFVQDPETIKRAKDLRKTPEWDIFIRYIDNTGLRIVFLMGLTLRYLESVGKPIATLRRRIKKRYGIEGLHVAYFVQNGCFSKLLANILEREPTPEKIKTNIENLFHNIEKTVVFIDTLDDIERKTKEIITKIDAHSPKTFIVSSARAHAESAGPAMKKCRKIRKNVMKEISGYTVELYKTETR